MTGVHVAVAAILTLTVAALVASAIWHTRRPVTRRARRRGRS